MLLRLLLLLLLLVMMVLQLTCGSCGSFDLRLLPPPVVLALSVRINRQDTVGCNNLAVSYVYE